MFMECDFKREKRNGWCWCLGRDGDPCLGGVSCSGHGKPGVGCARGAGSPGPREAPQCPPACEMLSCRAWPSCALMLRPGGFHLGICGLAGPDMIVFLSFSGFLWFDHLPCHISRYKQKLCTTVQCAAYLACCPCVLVPLQMSMED